MKKKTNDHSMVVSNICKNIRLSKCLCAEKIDTGTCILINFICFQWIDVIQIEKWYRILLKKIYAITSWTVLGTLVYVALVFAQKYIQCYNKFLWN